MARLLALFAWIAASLVLMSAPAMAEPADIDAAARGVVRVVIMGSEETSEGEEVYPIGHGTGWAVAPDRIVTNAHVVRDAMMDNRLRIGIVPSDGADAGYAESVAVDPRSDLALLRITSGLRLPPLTLAGGSASDSGEAFAVGYPMNVDRAQGLDIGDIFKSQPPVKSRGFLAGMRPSRNFDTVLHTAPIARGNSGGPLLDGCGRVLGVNSFGADSGGSDAEFFFAVSNRELIPFLRAHGVTARSNDTACRSLADLEDEERDRLEREQAAARQDMAARGEEQRERLDRARFEAEMQVRDERDDRMLGSMVLLLIGAGALWWGFEKRRIPEPIEDEPSPGAWPIVNRVALAAGGGAIVVALLVHLTRPGIDEIDRRVANVMQGREADDPGENRAASLSGTRSFVCRLDAQRSRVTNAQTEEIRFEWSSEGCVNGRTQYGRSGGTWSRALVPNDEMAVAVNSFDPERGVFRTERYLLARDAMATARAARGKYSAPNCEAEDAATTLGEMQTGVLAALPSSPNERLVYECEAE
ncbi:MAG: serine protease [Erythrobacter sp.]|nr:serine protease [Erythrobacter sp.]